jgi:hypothetical protein
LFRANAGEGVLDQGFVLVESFTALGANRQMFFEPVLLFLRELA